MMCERSRANSERSRVLTHDVEPDYLRCQRATMEFSPLTRLPQILPAARPVCDGWMQTSRSGAAD